MREIVLDTETTGLDPADGHRIVEIGGVELDHLVATGRVFHVYINPERPMPSEAEAVHGLSDAFLADKPVFADIAREFLDFIGEARLVIHNAAFDMRFLNAELARLALPPLPEDRARDTLAIARRRYPGGGNSLDVLCRRFGIDLGARTKHGALLDAELLAEVYLELMGGRQPGLSLAAASRDTATPVQATGQRWSPPPRPRPLPPRLTEAEAAAHDALVAELGPDALWHSARRS